VPQRALSARLSARRRSRLSAGSVDGLQLWRASNNGSSERAHWQRSRVMAVSWPSCLVELQGDGDVLLRHRGRPADVAALCFHRSRLRGPPCDAGPREPHQTVVLHPVRVVYVADSARQAAAISLCLDGPYEKPVQREPHHQLRCRTSSPAKFHLCFWYTGPVGPRQRHGLTASGRRRAREERTLLCGAVGLYKRSRGEGTQRQPRAAQSRDQR
jgi:hypothetical protein